MAPSLRSSCQVCAGPCDAMVFDLLCSFCGRYDHATCAGIHEDVALRMCQYACLQCTSLGKLSTYVETPTTDEVLAWCANIAATPMSTCPSHDKASLDFRRMLHKVFYASVAIRQLRPEDLTWATVQANGFRDPLFVTESIPGMLIPAITWTELPSLSGQVVAQTMDPCTMRMRRCDAADMHLSSVAGWNVEFPVAETLFERLLQPPPLVRDIDWFHQLNPTHSINPNTFVSLLGPGAFRDCRMSPRGTSTWFHVGDGSALRVFVMPPSAANVARFVQWHLAGDDVHRRVFLPDATDSCLCLDMQPNETLLLPPGWIYAMAVADTADAMALVATGLFYHGFSLPLQGHVLVVEALLAHHAPPRPLMDWPLVATPGEFAAPQRATGSLAHLFKYWLWPAMHMYLRRLKKQRAMSPWENLGLFQMLPLLRQMRPTMAVYDEEDDLPCGWFAGLTPEKIDAMVDALAPILAQKHTQEMTAPRPLPPKPVKATPTTNVSMAQEPASPPKPPPMDTVVKEDNQWEVPDAPVEPPFPTVESHPIAGGHGTGSPIASSNELETVAAAELKSPSRSSPRLSAKASSMPVLVSMAKPLPPSSIKGQVKTPRRAAAAAQTSTDDEAASSPHSFLTPMRSCSCATKRCSTCRNCEASHCRCEALSTDLSVDRLPLSGTKKTPRRPCLLCHSVYACTCESLARSSPKKKAAPPPAAAKSKRASFIDDGDTPPKSRKRPRSPPTYPVKKATKPHKVPSAARKHPLHAPVSTLPPPTAVPTSSQSTTVIDDDDEIDWFMTTPPQYQLPSKKPIKAVLASPTRDVVDLTTPPSSKTPPSRPPRHWRTAAAAAPPPPSLADDTFDMFEMSPAYKCTCAARLARCRRCQNCVDVHCTCTQTTTAASPALVAPLSTAARRQNQSRFVAAILGGRVKINDRDKADVAADLTRQGYETHEGEFDYLFEMPLSKLMRPKKSPLKNHVLLNATAGGTAPSFQE
ncbi:Aste57867_9215 [Aphanomyces stellatus]|uniref:Aste57867_9215 protein n=1 Tax=Aphanomyces stellatus TaxID=120398 RepID=A0A485KMG5_9STRA|nr:hypothetical protein As57867_009179 [Aphanomyces stellatus]VFT86098.1 Aste57867_9215 [Aphanomyces stellatus]